jgi:adenosylmethionine-8-amino-7-oxononanoate aminotransferase
LFRAFESTDRRRAFFHGHSFTASPIGCAAALASIEIARREDVPRRLDAIGAEIERALRTRLAPRARVRNVRRLGGIVAFDLGAEEAGYLAADPLPLRAAALERGVLLRPLGNVVYAMPPACTSTQQCERIAAAMAELAALAT